MGCRVDVSTPWASRCRSMASGPRRIPRPFPLMLAKPPTVRTPSRDKVSRRAGEGASAWTDRGARVADSLPRGSTTMPLPERAAIRAMRGPEATATRTFMSPLRHAAWRAHPKAGREWTLRRVPVMSSTTTPGWMAWTRGDQARATSVRARWAASTTPGETVRRTSSGAMERAWDGVMPGCAPASRAASETWVSTARVP